MSLLQVKLGTVGSFRLGITHKLLANIGDLKQESKSRFELAISWWALIEQYRRQLFSQLFNAKCILDALDCGGVEACTLLPLIEGCTELVHKCEFDRIDARIGI